MDNILIVESNLIEACSLANLICEQISNVRLYNIVLTGTKAISIINKNLVDIVIVNLNLLDMKGMDIINHISDNDLTKFKDSIIIYFNEDIDLSKTIKNKYIFSYCNRNTLLKNIKKLIEEKKKYNNTDIIKEKIKKELEKLHFNFSYIGTKYLYECIYECYCKNRKHDINLNKEIYPIISKKYNKTINTIKVDIFKSTYIMYYDVDENILSNYFGYGILKKPKIKDIIYKVLQKI